MTIEQFTTLLIRAGLSSKREAQELVASFQEVCEQRNMSVTVEAFRDFLVATNLFTYWQCEKLQMGKWKGFYLDNYLMLEQIDKDHEFAYYKARDTRDGKLVRMAVTPMPRGTEPGIDYHVYPYSE